MTKCRSLLSEKEVAPQAPEGGRVFLENSRPHKGFSIFLFFLRAASDRSSVPLRSGENVLFALIDGWHKGG